MGHYGTNFEKPVKNLKKSNFLIFYIFDNPGFLQNKNGQFRQERDLLDRRVHQLAAQSGRPLDQRKLPNRYRQPG
jgi:hypothetical protein